MKRIWALPWTLCGLLIGVLSLAAAPAAADEPRAVVDDVAVFRNLRYQEGSSPSLVLDLAMPRAAGEGPRPAVVVIHGGGWLEGDKCSFSTPDHPVPGNIFEFAKRGFVAAAINYRLSGEAKHPAGLDDCRAAVGWLRTHADEYRLDPRRIGAYGNSAGGHLALLLAMTDPPSAEGPQAQSTGPSARVQAAVSDSGPLDLLYGHQHNQLTVAIERLLGGPPTGDRAASYRRASPSSYVADKLPPLLLVYGALDEQVDVRTADEFVAALGRASGNDVSYLRLADAGHCPHSLGRVPYLRPAVEDFFVRVLKP